VARVPQRTTYTAPVRHARPLASPSPLDDRDPSAHMISEAPREHEVARHRKAALPLRQHTTVGELAFRGACATLCLTFPTRRDLRAPGIGYPQCSWHLRHASTVRS
jgi:hypothetical protein